jgi:hypothetical protein
MRSVAAVAIAIGLCRPGMPQEQRERYARVLVEEGREQGIDPLTVVALVHNESKWISSAINQSSGALGLGQVLPQFRPQCRVAPESEACLAEKAALLDGVHNLRVATRAAGAWRRSCRAKLGRVTTEAAWLVGYGGFRGFNNPKRGLHCGHKKARGKWRQVKPWPSLVRRILKHKRQLDRQARSASRSR